MKLKKLIALISILALLIVVTTLIIIANEVDIGYGPGKKGLDVFVDNYEIPLTIIGSFLVIISLTVAIYRTNRADKQFALSERNSFVSNYFELSEEYSFKAINCNLKTNLSNLVPEIKDANTTLDNDVKVILDNYVDLINNILKNWDFGTATGLTYLTIYFEILVPLSRKISLKPDLESISG